MASSSTAGAGTRAVVTGLGVVTSIGVGKEPFWAALVAGSSRVGDARGRTGLAIKNTRCCLVSDERFDAAAAEAFRERGLDRGASLALEAATQALADAGIEGRALPPGRLGMALGTTLGESPAVERLAEARRAGGDLRLRPQELQSCAPPALHAAIAAAHRVSGPTVVVPAACAAGNYAIGYSLDRIRRGQADVMLAGGVEPFSATLHIGFSRMRLVASECCQPFDKGRQGLLVGEGAGFVVLESYEHARRRGARLYAEVVGYGTSCDAHHVTAPEPEGRGAALALARALAAARVNAADVGYVNAHGTGTPANDLAETRAIKQVFGEAARRLPVSSIKSMIGHTMGAAGAIEAVASALVLERGVLPPTINYREPDPECDLDCVPNVARQVPVRLLVSNSYGFLGHNASVVMAAV